MGVYEDLLSVRQQKDSARGVVKRASWAVQVEGVDITEQLNTDLISLTVTDNEEDEADDLNITVQDKDGKWLKWLDDSVQAAADTKALRFGVWIGSLDSDGKISQQKSGTFTLDSITHAGPPSKATIKGTSLSFGGGIRDEKRSKSWEGYTLEGIARDIAVRAKMTMMYCSDETIYYPAQEQSDETDIAFLKRLCQNAGMALKCIDNKIVVFDKDHYGSASPIKVVSYADGSYTKWSLNTTSGDVTYDLCCVRYCDPAPGQLIEGVVYTDDYDKTETDHTQLVVTDVKVSSVAEALQVAEERLKLRNQYEKTAQFTFPGDPTLMAGLTMYLTGFGYFDGKYMIKKCEHTISDSGYTTRVTLRMIPHVNETTAFVKTDYFSKN